MTKRSFAGKRNSTYAKCALGCVIFLFLLCGRLPTETGASNFDIQLSLEQEFNTAATYSGKVITAIVDLPDSQFFSQIAWHTGSGSYSTAGIAPNKKVKQVKVCLFWNFIPTNKDSLNKMAYDTVYVSLNGETVRSNTVKVYVTNIPPVIDSVWINSTSLKGSDTVRYNCLTSDTNTRFSIRVSAHDINNDIIHYEWLSSRGLQLPQFPLVVYDVPKFQFTDSLYLNCYDGKGGNAIKYILIAKVAPNVPPVLDSIKIGSKTFGSDSLLHTYSVRKIDTLKLRLYARDSDSKDSFTVTWRHTNSKDSLIRNSSSPSMVTLLCDTIFRDSNALLRTVDTVYAVVKDAQGDSVKTVIRIVQGIVNTSPRIDSLRINANIQCKGAAALFKDSASARDTFILRVFASDPDSLDSAKIMVYPKVASALTRVSDTLFRYVAKDSIYTDSILCFAKDTHADSVKKTVVISVVNRYPIMNSLAVSDTFRKKDTLFYTRDSALIWRINIPINDSVKVRLFAHDPDVGQKDSITQVQWTLSNAKTMKLLNAGGTLVQYPGPSVPATDTISVRIFDRKQKWVSASMIFNVGHP